MKLNYITGYLKEDFCLGWAQALNTTAKEVSKTIP